MAAKTEVKCVDKSCEGCCHLTETGSGEPWCDYIGDTGRMRPCQAGSGCTEKRKKKRKTKRFAMN